MTTPVCVVTGSSSGIGAAVAQRYAREGWRVVINYSRNEAPAQAVAKSCQELGAEVYIHKANIANNDECIAMANAVKQLWGRVDVLVNNAGTTKFVPIKQLDALEASDFHHIYDVNVIGAFHMTRAFEPLLKQNQNAAIINISSIASMMGQGSSLAYMASKGALNALTFGLARALGPSIRVNAIAPGLVDSPWLKEGWGPEIYQKLVDQYTSQAALADIIQPEDVAAAAWFLGVEAKKTTGEVFLIDGGLRLTKA